MAGISWVDFIANTKARAEDVNNNFDWIQGDIVPMTAGAKTNGAYSLGETANAWKDIYLTGSIIVQGQTAMTFLTNGVSFATGHKFILGNSFLTEETTNTVSIAPGSITAMTWTPNQDTAIPAGKKYYLDGVGGTAYIWKSTTSTVDILVDSTIAATFIPEGVYILQGQKIGLDGSMGSNYILKSGAGQVELFADGTVFLQNSGSVLYSGRHFMPSLDDSTARQLGSASFHWYGVWYGAGGLNQKPCFQDLKENIEDIPLDNIYDTLPDFTSHKRKETGNNEKGFTIKDNAPNKNKYKYISTDADGKVSLRLDHLIAQMAVAIKRLNARVSILENA